MIIETTLIEKRLDIDANLNLNELIKDSHNIISIESCHVSGTFLFDLELLNANLNVNTMLLLAESKTLEPIEYNLNFDLKLIFGNSENSDYALEDTINLNEIIYGHILVYKPLVLYLNEEVVEEQEKKVNPAFSELKDWKL